MTVSHIHANILSAPQSNGVEVTGMGSLAEAVHVCSIGVLKLSGHSGVNLLRRAVH
jgi:hypothetical protein